jgi:hypothetical protein
VEISLFFFIFAAFALARLLAERVGLPTWLLWLAAGSAFFFAYVLFGNWAANGDFEKGITRLNPWLEPVLWLLPALWMGVLLPEIWTAIKRRPWRVVIIVVGGCIAIAMLQDLMLAGMFIIFGLVAKDSNRWLATEGCPLQADEGTGPRRLESSASVTCEPSWSAPFGGLGHLV